MVRTASVSVVTPYAVWNGRLQNPDSVLRQFGTWYGLAFYRLMLQQNLSLAADAQQWIDRINAIDRAIKPGDPDDDVSNQLADDVRSWWARVPNKKIVCEKILQCRLYGFTAIGKAGWRKDDATGLTAPFDLYDIPSWNIKFGPNGEEYLLTQRNMWMGDPIPPRSVMYARWGSIFTPYGESDLKDIYLSCWYIQNVQEMMLASIEVLGKPIPWIEVSDALQGQEFDDFEAGIAKQYKYYVITRTPNARTSTSFPNLNVLAAGGAGRSELEFIRYHSGLISRRVLGTQQTQDRTGGSRALEDTRMEIAHDKTPPGSQLLDETLTIGLLDDIGAVNYPDIPRTLWPRFDSDAGDVGKDRVTGPQIVAVQSVADQLRMNQITDTWAIETLVMAGYDRAKAEYMVESMTDPAAKLDRMPPPIPQPFGAKPAAAEPPAEPPPAQEGQ